MPFDEDDRDALYEELRAQIERERGPRAWLRERSTPVRIGILGALAALVVGGVAWWRGGGLSGSPGWLVGFGALAVLGGLAMASALRPLSEPDGPTRGRLLAAGGLVLGALGSLVVASDGSWGEASGLPCLLVGTLVGLPVFAAARLLDRNPWRGVLFGALTAGLAGVAALQLICPSPHLGHLVVGHFGALLVSAGLFAAVGGLLSRRA